MKTKILIIFCVSLLLGLLFALKRSISKHDSSVEAAYDAGVKNIGGMLSAIHSNLSAKNCVIPDTGASVSLNLAISFNEKEGREPFALSDPWGNELLISVLSNRYIKIVSAGPDKVFDSKDDIVGTLALTNSLEISVHGRYKGSVFLSSISSTEEEVCANPNPKEFFHYPSESNVVATVVSYQWLTSKFPHPVFTIPSRDDDSITRLKGILFQVDKPERFAGRFFLIQTDQDAASYKTEQHYKVGSQYFFEFSEKVAEIKIGMCPLDMVSLTESNLWAGRLHGFPYFSDITKATQHKERLEAKRRALVEEVNATKQKLDAFEGERINANRKFRELYSKHRDLKLEIAEIDMYLDSAIFQLDKLKNVRSEKASDVMQ